MQPHKIGLAIAAALACLVSVAGPAQADGPGALSNPYRTGTANCGAKNVMLLVDYNNSYDLHVVIRRSSDDSYWENTIRGIGSGAFKVAPVATPLTDGSWQATVLNADDDALNGVTYTCV